MYIAYLVENLRVILADSAAARTTNIRFVRLPRAMLCNTEFLGS